MKRAAPALLAFAAVLIGAGTAHAAPPGRGAPIVVNCTVSASSINFGIYDPLAAGGDASTGTLRVACNGSGRGATTITVGVSLSAGLSGTYATRTMLSGTNQLNYNIYWDPQYTVVMGDGTGGSSSGSAGPITVYSGGSVQATGTMYGYVPARQDVAAGSYSDVITVTVTY